MAAAAAIAACGGRPCKQLTLLLLHSGGRVLLGMKKRGFGKGKYNGFGGKIEPGESIYAAAVREMHEESGVRVPAPHYLGHLVFEFVGVSTLLHVHVCVAEEGEGEPVETEEMAPQWFNVEAIPFERMWLDDALWFPFVLSRRMFQGYFLFDGHDVILRHALDGVSALPHDPSTAKLVTEVQSAIDA